MSVDIKTNIVVSLESFFLFVCLSLCVCRYKKIVVSLMSLFLSVSLCVCRYKSKYCCFTYVIVFV